ncbi:GTP-binding protein gtr1 [Balamuthia mandrillaris]
MMKKKVLLMGKSGSGKTSMRSIIFANYIARDTTRLAATIDVEHSHVRFLGNLALNLWDCGGQEAFMENYFSNQKDHIFRNVEVLIYVFDVESNNLEKDMKYYHSCLDAIQQNSGDAKIFCLIHKMDLVPEDQREKIFSQKESELKQASLPMDITCFATSIWDETLYKAWSSIVYALIPNIDIIENRLSKFCTICEADEVVLFERATFLVISHASTKKHKDVHRFEKISNIIKQFKLSCSKTGAHFQNMEVRNSNFSAFIDLFTANTYIMVIMSDPTIQSTATLVNIKVARKHFEKYLRNTEAETM